VTGASTPTLEDAPVAPRIRDALRAAVRARRLSCAYLLQGRDGSGKRALARAVAAAALCPRAPEVGDACGACGACRRVAHDTHPDLLELAVEPGKREIPIDAIREAIAFLALAPLEAAGRAVIVDAADRLGDEAANALLKTLEEPPPGAILVLLTSRPEAVLPTVRSRCQPVRLVSASGSARASPRGPSPSPSPSPTREVDETRAAIARRRRLADALLASEPAAVRLGAIAAEVNLELTAGAEAEAVRQELIAALDLAVAGLRTRLLERALRGEPFHAEERAIERLLGAARSLEAYITTAVVIRAVLADVRLAP